LMTSTRRVVTRGGLRGFFAFVRGEVPQADSQVARAPYRVDLTPSG